MKIRDYFKQILWYIIVPFFWLGRDLSKIFGYRPFPKRQEYHLGWLNSQKNNDDFKKFLMSIGFTKNRLAWIDEEEILSLRLLKNFKYQYHLRLFSDGEIRGHYELTPEYSPFDHLHDKDTSAKEVEFKQLLGDWLVLNPEK